MPWLIRRLLKLDSPITVGQWCYDRLTGNWLLIVSVFGGGTMSYLAAISKWLEPWGPVGWGLVGLFGVGAIALLLSVIYFIISSATEKRARTEYQKARTLASSGDNYLQDSFEKRIIKLSDMYNPFDLSYKRKVFKECDFHGPGALLFITDCRIQSPQLYHTDLVVEANGPIVSAVGFEESSFFDCRFFNITLIISPRLAQAIGADMARNGFPQPVFLGAPFSKVQPTDRPGQAQSSPGQRPQPAGKSRQTYP